MADPEAIGLIETRGFIPLVVAVEAMSKSAHVSFLGIENIGDGLVTAVIGGDISSVTHAAEVGSAAAAGVGEVIGVQIIGRLVGNMRDLLPMEGNFSLRSEARPEGGMARSRALPTSAVPQLPAGEPLLQPYQGTRRGGRASRRKSPKPTTSVQSQPQSERGITQP